MGRFCKMAIFFLWAVARPGFSLLICEMAFRLKSVHHIRHLGSTILSRDNFQEIMRIFYSSKYPGRYEVWAGVMFHILFLVLSTILVDGVYLELSKNPGTA